MSPSDPVLICFSYEHRSEEEAQVFKQITQLYADRGIPTHNLYDAELHEKHEAGFNLARWEALCRFITENDLQDNRIIMQDITDVYVADPNLEFDEQDVYVNRKKNCQYHALKTLRRDLVRPNLERVNLSRRIDIDVNSLEASDLKALFVDPRYRSIHRFSNDVLWGYGRNFLTLFEIIGRNIERVPARIRFGNCDETLFTYFHLQIQDDPLNIKFGERFCQNYNYIAQEIFGGRSASQFLRSRNIFTYQHSERVPALITDMSASESRTPLEAAGAALVYVADNIVSAFLSAASVLLQGLKSLLIAGLFVGRRVFSS